MDDLVKLEEQFSRKLDKYWAENRSTLNLLAKSEQISDAHYQAVRDELSDILDSGIINYPQTFQEAGLSPEMSYQEKKQKLGLRLTGFQRSVNEEKFITDMAYKAHIMRKSNWTWRIAEESEEKHRLGWHPFFVTLTVDPTKADAEELWREGREFRKYIRRIADVVCAELGHPPCRKPPYRPESDYVTYAGVVEHGKSRKHHHGHFLIWIRVIPASWRICPNKGRLQRNRTQNECIPMRSLWPWSAPKLSPALYFRYQGDIWERIYNFVLPIDKNGKPMKVSNCKVAGYYITKYLAKEHREWHHRMKATRNLGMKRLKVQIAKFTNEQIEALMWRAKDSNSNHLLQTIHGVPLGLVRSLAKQRDFLNKFRRNQLDLKMLLQSNYGVFSKMLQSVQAGARPDRMDSSAFFDWVGQFLHDQRGFCEKRQFEAHAKLQKYFPPERAKIKHVKLGANQID